MSIYNYGLWGGWWRIKDLVARENAPVSMVARDPEKLDVFSVRDDGAVMTAAWEQDVADGAWRGWWADRRWRHRAGRMGDRRVARAAQAGRLHGGDWTAASTTAAWEYNVARGAWRGWWRIKDLVAVPGTYVAAVARHPDKLDVFAVRTDGGDSRCRLGTRFVANNEWRGWWSVANLRTTGQAYR